MSSPTAMCPHCGSPSPPGALACPACHATLAAASNAPPRPAAASVAPRAEVPAPPPAPAKRAASPRPPRAAASNPFAADFARRVARLAQWSESARALGIDLPRVPAWAQEAAARSSKPEAWAEVVRGIERLAQQRIVTALEAWEGRTRSRLTRLEAYSVDSRLERDQIEDAVHAARAGDVPQAFVAYHQVDRVVTLKERHLDQARDDLERLVSFLSDISALGLGPPEGPADVGAELEAELRAGRLAPLKQQIRTLRQEALTRLQRDLAAYLATNGERLLSERSRGASNGSEATELARGAREVFRGRPEEGVRRLRALRQPRGLSA
jgi:hypothetical protein